jgi:hypothetical protein
LHEALTLLAPKPHIMIAAALLKAAPFVMLLSHTEVDEADATA